MGVLHSIEVCCYEVKLVNIVKQQALFASVKVMKNSKSVCLFAGCDVSLLTDGFKTYNLINETANSFWSTRMIVKLFRTLYFKWLTTNSIHLEQVM